MGGRGAYRNITNGPKASTQTEKNRKRGNASDKINNVIRDLKSPNGYSSQKPFAIGLVEKRMSDYADANDIELSSKSIYISTKSIAHAIRKSKNEKGLAVSAKHLADFPNVRRAMDLYYDGKSFIYTDYRTKYIIHPNYKIKINGKKVHKVNFVTAGRVTDPKEFTLKKYIKIY